MGENSSSHVSESPQDYLQGTLPKSAPPKRKLYFINEEVEWLLTQYIWTGCTRVFLRDAIMANATELIRQIIRKQGLHTIYPGQDESSFGDLLNVAWTQIERCLYKYRSRPHCRTCFDFDRPSDSLLYIPGEFEYGIKTFEEVMRMDRERAKHQGLIKVTDGRCARCGRKLTTGPLIQPEQHIYGGSETILYRGSSKVFNMWCVTPDTLLFSDQGIEPIGCLIDRTEASGDFDLDARPVVHGLARRHPVNGFLRKPPRKVLTVKTALSFEITCTPRHGLYALTEHGPDWVSAGSLRIDDLLGIQYQQDFFVGDDGLAGFETGRRGDWQCLPSMTEELAYIVGLFIAEGSYSYGKLVVYNVDKDAVERLLNNTLGLNFIHEPKYQRVSLCNVRFIEFLKWLGFGEHTQADTKFVPRRLLRGSKAIQLALLSGMFDGDGGSSRHDGTVTYTSTSSTLIRQVRMLLLNLGIISKLSHDKRRTRTFPKGYTSQLRGATQVVLSAHDSKLFYDIVGFGIKRKAEKQEAISERPLLYGFNDHFRALYHRHGPGGLGYDAVRRVLKAKRCTLDTAKRKLLSWADYPDDPDYRAILGRIQETTAAQDRIIWLPVRSIAAGKAEVCEISVADDSHSYIANGIVSHNSQISRTVILAYIKKEGRDRKNAPTYMGHLTNRGTPTSDAFGRFLKEAHEVCKYHESYQVILEAIKRLANVDPRPHDGIIGKLIEETGLSRQTVAGFIKFIKLRSMEFSDAPVNRGPDPLRYDRRRHTNVEFDDE